MLGLSTAEAVAETHVAASSLSLLVVSPRAGSAQELGAIANGAAPSDTVVICGDADEAVSKATTGVHFGRQAGVFIFDYRGRPVSELADQLRKVRQAYADAELVVVIDAGDEDTPIACLRIARAPGQLTFLLTPLQRREIAEVIKGVADRYRTMRVSRNALANQQETIASLESSIEELRARLDIAMHAARHDGLTGILNRAGFMDELTTRLSRSKQQQTVLLVDLDRFKSVNDTLGHDAGDDLVRKICAAMATELPAGGVLARLGGDEFGICLEGLSQASLDEFCKLLLRVCNQSRRISGHEVQVSASIGVARQTAQQSHLQLMRSADLALYAAKREGRNRYRVYDSVIEKAAHHRLSIEMGLERALNTSQFKMAYQPIVEAQDGKIVGFEALIRWNSPEHGPISPADFVPVAEEMGIILELGDWITRQALKDCRRWGGDYYVSVNLSARQFLRHNIAERVLQFAQDADLPADRIQIELTETAIIDDVERADGNLRTLRNAGVRVALDDFGTGYSSLVYLNQFAIDCIKIDKSFVDNVARDRQSAVIVASVTKLAASLGMSVVAEGVENETQRQVLIAAGCGMLQGYHFGKPMSAQEVGELLASRSGPVDEETAEPRYLGALRS